MPDDNGTCMKSKLLSESGRKTFAIVFDTGDEVLTGLLNFAREQNLTAAHFTAVGACERVTIAFFDLKKKKYDENPINEQVEVMSLIGNIALYENEPKIHAHIIIGKADGTAHGGHLIEAIVRPTLELFLIASPTALIRKMNESFKIPLIDLNE